MPPKGLLIRFQRMVRPTLPVFSVAPMTATVRGEKKKSSGRCEGRRMSWAGSVLLDLVVLINLSSDLLRAALSVTRGMHLVLRTESARGY